ncbi:condensation domain-containing protein [Actinosynnema sp. NPDC023794]
MDDGLERRVPSRAQVYKASSVQSRLMMMRYAPGGVAAQVVGVHLLLRGPVDVERLRRGLIELTRRHDILRTNYALSESGEVLAVVHENEGPDVLDVARTTGLVDERGIRDHGNTLMRTMVGKFTSPDRHSILQAVLARHAADVHSLVLAIDHVAVDERSKALLQRELAALYAGRVDDLGEPHPYDPASVRNVFPAIDETPGLRELLTPLPPRVLASPDPQRDPDAFRPVVASRTLGTAVWDRVGEAARRLRCTRFVVHVAAVMWALKRFSDSDDISVVTAMDTRLRPQDFDTVGFFQNLVLLRSRSPRSAGVAATLEECRTIVRDAFRRRDYPIASLVAAARAERGEAGCRNPLYQIALAYAVEDVDLGWRLDGVDVEPVELDFPEAAIELFVYLTESPSDTKALLLGAAGALGSPELDRLLTLWREAVGVLTGDDPATRDNDGQRLGSSVR